MELTAIGYGLLPVTLCLAFWPTRLAQLVLVAAVFGAAAPIVMSGGADALALPSPLLPGLVFIAIVALQTLFGNHPPAAPEVARMLLPFLLFAVWALASAYLFPRIFIGALEVWPQRLEGDLQTRVVLAPDAGNVTQSFYLIANTLTLLFGALFFARPGTHDTMFLRAYLLSGYLVVGICFWEFLNKSAGLYFPQDFFYSNPRWAILADQTYGEVSRINGPFTEPAGLAGYLAGIVFATLNLALRGHHNIRIWGLLALSIVAIALSTSTTGLVVIFIFVPLLILRGLVVGAHSALRFVGIGIAGALVLGVVGFLSLPIIAPHIDAAAHDVVDATLAKRQSQSYEDRTTKDIDSLALLGPSYGLGAGWGSVRSSSLVPGILGNCGVPGVLLLLWFAIRMTKRIRAAQRVAPPETDLSLSALSWSLLGNLSTALLASPTISDIDFFLRFAMVVGCCARLQSAAAPASRHGAPLAGAIGINAAARRAAGL